MVIDPYIDAVRDTTRHLDAQLVTLCDLGAEDDDPDTSTSYDVADYLCGLGFVALQQFMTCLLADRRISRLNAVNRGPIRECGAGYTALINAAANYWKRSSE